MRVVLPFDGGTQLYTVCIYIYISVCVYVHIYVCIYIYIHMGRERERYFETHIRHVFRIPKRNGTLEPLAAVGLQI